jgi:hypothetical protein
MEKFWIKTGLLSTHGVERCANSEIAVRFSGSAEHASPSDMPFNLPLGTAAESGHQQLERLNCCTWSSLLNKEQLSDGWDESHTWSW